MHSPGGATVHDACVSCATAVVGVGTEGLSKGFHVDQRRLPHGSVLESHPRPRAARRVPAVSGGRPAQSGDSHRTQELLQEPLHGRHRNGKEAERRRLDVTKLTISRQRLSHLTSFTQTIRLKRLTSLFAQTNTRVAGDIQSILSDEMSYMS